MSHRKTARWDLTQNGPLRSVRIDRKVVTSFWDQRLPFVVPRSALAAIDGVEDPTDASGFISAMSSPLLPLLRTHALQDGHLREVTFNALYREKQGGREYPMVIPGYRGSLCISKNKYNAATVRYLLSATPRVVRDHFDLPAGWSQLVADFKSCHPHMAGLLSGDAQMLADVATGDMHKVTGSWMSQGLGALAANDVRDLGKWMNNKMLFGLTRKGLAKGVYVLPGVLKDEAWATTIWHEWWARYPTLWGLYSRIQDYVAGCGARDEHLDIISPGGWRSGFSPAELRGTAPARNGQPKGPDGAARSVFSAVFRAVESDLLRLTIINIVRSSSEGCVKGVLPLYDGLYLGCRPDDVEQATAIVEAAAKQAAMAMGLPGMHMKVSPAKGPKSSKGCS